MGMPHGEQGRCGQALRPAGVCRSVGAAQDRSARLYIIVDTGSVQKHKKFESKGGRRSVDGGRAEAERPPEGAGERRARGVET